MFSPCSMHNILRSSHSALGIAALRGEGDDFNLKARHQPTRAQSTLKTPCRGASALASALSPAPCRCALSPGRKSMITNVYHTVCARFENLPKKINKPCGEEVKQRKPSGATEVAPSAAMGW